jgi:hypothetical protein
MLLHMLDHTALFLWHLCDQRPWCNGDSTIVSTVCALAGWIEVCGFCAKGVFTNIPQRSIYKQNHEEVVLEILRFHWCFAFDYEVHWLTGHFWRRYWRHMTFLSCSLKKSIRQSSQNCTYRRQLCIVFCVNDCVCTCTNCSSSNKSRKKTKCCALMLLSLFWIG